MRVRMLLLLQLAMHAAGMRLHADVRGAASAGQNLLEYMGYFAVASDGSGASVAVLDYVCSVVTDSPSARLLVMTEASYERVAAPVVDCDTKLAAAVTIAELPPGSSIGRAIVVNRASPVYMYAAVPVCNGTSAAVSCDLHITFSGTGYAEVPYSAVGIVQTYIITFLAAVVCLLALVISQEWLLHASWVATPLPVKLAGLSCFLWGCGCGFMLVHWVAYTINGEGEPSLEGTARVADALARLVAAILLLLLVKGWRLSPTVTGSRPADVSALARLIIAVAAGCLGCLYIALAGWYLQDRDVTSTLYAYDSPPGLVICAMYTIVGALFALQGVLSWHRFRDAPGARRFFVVLTAGFVSWFAIVPIAVLVGNTLPDYEDERCVEITEAVASIVFYAAAVYALRPSVSQTVFNAYSQLIDDLDDPRVSAPILPKTPRRKPSSDGGGGRSPAVASPRRRSSGSGSFSDVPDYGSVREHSGESYDNVFNSSGYMSPGVGAAAMPTMGASYAVSGSPVPPRRSTSFASPGPVVVLPTIVEVTSPSRSAGAGGVPSSASTASTTSSDDEDSRRRRPTSSSSLLASAPPSIRAPGTPMTTGSLRTGAGRRGIASPPAPSPGSGRAGMPASPTPRSLGATVPLMGTPTRASSARTSVVPAGALTGVPLDRYLASMGMDPASDAAISDAFITAAYSSPIVATVGDARRNRNGVRPKTMSSLDRGSQGRRY